jgi:hypothetical protein
LRGGGRMSQPRQEETSFLNVDLDIEGPFDLAPLVEALGETVYALYTGPLDAGFQTHLELSGGSQPKDADTAIQRFAELLALLGPVARRLWDTAAKREFNIGVQAGTRPHAFELTLRPETLAAVAGLRARVALTVYAVDPASISPLQRRRSPR